MKKTFLVKGLVILLGLVVATQVNAGVRFNDPASGWTNTTDVPVWAIVSSGAGNDVGGSVDPASSFPIMDWNQMFATFNKNENGYNTLVGKFSVSVLKCPAKTLTERMGTQYNSSTSVPFLRKVSDFSDSYQNYGCTTLKIGTGSSVKSDSITMEIKNTMDETNKNIGTATNPIIVNSAVLTYISSTGMLLLSPDPDNQYSIWTDKLDQYWARSSGWVYYDANNVKEKYDSTAAYVYRVTAFENLMNFIPKTAGNNSMGNFDIPHGYVRANSEMSSASVKPYATVTIIQMPKTGPDVDRLTELSTDPGDIRLRLDSSYNLPSYTGLTEMGKAHSAGDHYTASGQRIFGQIVGNTGYTSDPTLPINLTYNIQVDGSATKIKVYTGATGNTEMDNFLKSNKVYQYTGRPFLVPGTVTTIWVYDDWAQDNLITDRTSYVRDANGNYVNQYSGQFDGLPAWFFARDIGASSTGYELTLSEGSTGFIFDATFTAKKNWTQEQGFYVYNHVFTKKSAGNYQVDQQTLPLYDKTKSYKLNVKNKATGKSKDYVMLTQNMEREINYANQALGSWPANSHLMLSWEYPTDASLARGDTGGSMLKPSDSAVVQGHETAFDYEVPAKNAAMALTNGIILPTIKFYKSTHWASSLTRYVGQPFASASRGLASYAIQIYDIPKDKIEYCYAQGFPAAHTWTTGASNGAGQNFTVTGTNADFKIASFYSLYFKETPSLAALLRGGDDALAKEGITKRFAGQGMLMPANYTAFSLDEDKSLTAPKGQGAGTPVGMGNAVWQIKMPYLTKQNTACSILGFYGSDNPYSASMSAATVSFQGILYPFQSALSGTRPNGVIMVNNKPVRQTYLDMIQPYYEDLSWDQLKANPKEPGAIYVLRRAMAVNIENWQYQVGANEIMLATFAPQGTGAGISNQFVSPHQNQYGDGVVTGYLVYEIVRNGTSEGVKMKKYSGSADGLGVKTTVSGTDELKIYIAYMDQYGYLSDVFVRTVNAQTPDFRDSFTRPALRMTASNEYQTAGGQYNLTSSTAMPSIIPTQYAHQAVFYSTSASDFCKGAPATTADPILKWYFDGGKWGFKPSTGEFSTFVINARKKVGSTYQQVSEFAVPSTGGTSEICVRLGDKSLGLDSSDMAFAVRAVDSLGMTSDWAVVGEDNATVTKFWNEVVTGTTSGTTGATGVGTSGSSPASAPAGSSAGLSQYQMLPGQIAGQMDNSTPNAGTAGASAAAGKTYRPVGLFIDNNNLYYQRLAQPAGTTKLGLTLKYPTYNPTYYPLQEAIFNQADDLNNGQRAVIVTDGATTDPNIPTTCNGAAATKTRPIVVTYTNSQNGFQIIPSTAGTITGFEFYLEQQIPGTRNWNLVPVKGASPMTTSYIFSLTNSQQYIPGDKACYQSSDDLPDGNYRIFVKAVSSEKNSASAVAGQRADYLKSDIFTYEFSIVAGALGGTGATGTNTGTGTTVTPGSGATFIRPAGAFFEPLPACLSATPPCAMPIPARRNVTYQDINQTSGKLAIIPAKKNPSASAWPIWTTADEQASVQVQTTGSCRGAVASNIQPLATTANGFKALVGGNILGYEWLLKMWNGSDYILASNATSNASQFTTDSCYISQKPLPNGKYRVDVKGVLDQRDPANLSQYLKSDIFAEIFDVTSSGIIIIPTTNTSGGGANSGSSVNGSDMINNPPATFITP